MGSLDTPFPYPGGKTRLADWIIDQMPDHRRYVEVFGGAASVLYQKAPATEEVYNDLNTDLTHFFETVVGQPDALADWLANVNYDPDRYDRWADAYYDGTRSDEPVERAGRFYFLRYASFNGAIAHKSGFRGTDGPSDPSATWDRARSRERLHELADRFAAVEIRALDWRHVLAEYDDSGTLFYLDPPYLDREHYYRATEFAHDELAATLADLDARWLVSYDCVPDALACQDVFVVETDHYYHMAEASGGDGETVERLVCNFDPGVAEVQRGQTDLAAFS